MLATTCVSVGRADPPANEPADKPVETPAADALDASQTPAAATIEKIMEQAVRNIAMRYNLNEAQAEATSKLMKREVHRFLKEHENEIWPAIRDLLGTQLGGKPPEDASELRRIGEAVRPLAKLAKEAIIRGNEEWRLYLNVEQKRVHDFDMAEIETTFEQIDRNLGEWEAGRLTEGGLFPQPRLEGRQPARPRKPQSGLPDPEVEIFDPSHIFDTLVADFIREYELDEGQKTSARSILEEFKGKALDYRRDQKLAFGSIAAEQQLAYKERDRAGIEKATAKHKKLLAPVYHLYAEMTDRLEALLTTAQIQRHAERNPTDSSRAAKATVTKKASSKARAGATTEPDAIKPDQKGEGH